MNFKPPTLSSEGADAGAQCIVPAFGSGGYTQPFWFVAKIHKRFGVNPSVAEIVCPTDKFGGKAPLMTLLSESPRDNVRGYTKVICRLNGATVFIGFVNLNDENFDQDGIIAEAADARWLLAGGALKGSFWLEDEGSSVAYRQSEPAHFNQDGLPNRIHGENGLTYAFCEVRYGLREGEPSPPPSVNSSDFASHWDPASMWVYLCETLDRSIVGDLVSEFAEYWFCPADIILPKGAAAMLTAFTVNQDNPSVGQRVAAEVVWNATEVSDAAQHIVEAAGPFALGVDFDEDGNTTVTIVPSRNIGGSGKQLRVALGAASNAFGANGKVVGGGLRRDWRNHCSQVVYASDKIYAERRVESSDKVSIAAQQTAGVELITAWNPTLVDRIIADYNLAVDNGQNIPIEDFIQQYPLAFEAWRLNPDIDLADGTGETPRTAKVTHRIALPHLLTCFSGRFPDGRNKLGELTSVDLKTQQMPVWIEIGDTVDDPTPVPAAVAFFLGDNGAAAPQAGDDPPNPDDGPADPNAGQGGYEEGGGGANLAPEIVRIGLNPRFVGAGVK